MTIRKLVPLLIFCACIPWQAYTQENPAPYFICLYNGRVMLPFLGVKPENRQRIKTVTLLQPSFNENKGSYDTAVSYRQWYAPDGEEVTIEGNAYAEFMGFRDISFNKDGTLASKTFETRGTRGCGNYHWQVGGVIQYNYEYKNGRCIKIITGDSSYTVNTYNDKGLMVATTNAYYVMDAGEKQLRRGAYSYQYRYNASGRLMEEYKIGDFPGTKAGEIANLPAHMLQILLRQTPEFKNDHLISEFGISEDSLYVYRADLPDTFVKRIDDRDAQDDQLIERYQEMTRYFTGYEYNGADLPVKRYLFDGDDLEQVETFTYDDKNRLVRWSRLTDFYEPDNWSKGSETIWTFNYNADNQTLGCERREYTRTYRSGYSEKEEKPALILDETQSFDFTYNSTGAVATMSVSYKNGYSAHVNHYLVGYTFF